MKERYKYTNIKINKNGKRVFETTLYPIIERTDEDLYIRSTRGDRLDLYAMTYYGDTRFWPILAQANQLGKGSLMVPADMQIRIPPYNTDFDKKLKDLNTSL